MSKSLYVILGITEDENRDKYKICNTSRYISHENDGANIIVDD